MKVWRITPAYAGTTPVPRQLALDLEDHPRIRGNHPQRKQANIEIRGSPPHTREPPYGVGDEYMDTRITPAYAGTTRSFSRTSSGIRDHPRIRGNHRFRTGQRVFARGSPPHTREPQEASTPNRMCAGITPAYAGTTDKRSLKINVFTFRYREKH